MHLRLFHGFTFFQHFNRVKQKNYDTILSRLISIFVKNSNDGLWMNTIQKFLHILFEIQSTELFVSKTLVHFYTEVLLTQHEPNIEAEFLLQLEQTSQYLLKVILNTDIRVLEIIIQTLFSRIEIKPALIRLEPNGLIQIIKGFLTIESLVMNITALNSLIRLRRNNDLLRLCAQPPIVDVLTHLICKLKSIKIRRLALELAVYIQT